MATGGGERKRSVCSDVKPDTVKVMTLKLTVRNCFSALRFDVSMTFHKEFSGMNVASQTADLKALLCRGCQTSQRGTKAPVENHRVIAGEIGLARDGKSMSSFCCE
jgi:hypothetical protein